MLNSPIFDASSWYPCVRANFFILKRSLLVKDVQRTLCVQAAHSYIPLFECVLWINRKFICKSITCIFVGYLSTTPMLILASFAMKIFQFTFFHSLIYVLHMSSYWHMTIKCALTYVICCVWMRFVSHCVCEWVLVFTQAWACIYS